MSDVNIDLSSTKKRRTLWIVLFLNILIAIGFFITGYQADSSSLIANGLDNSSDAIVYGLSLFALTRSRKWKRGAARISAIMLLVFAIGIIIDTVHRFTEGSTPIGMLMMGMAFFAAIVNLISLYLLKKLANKDVNLRAATIFSFNDFIANGGIIIAAIIVIFTGSNWPDLVVGLAVAAIAVYGSIEIWRDSKI